MSSEVGTTTKLVPQVGVGGICVAIVENDATATPRTRGTSDKRAGFADADFGVGQAGVNLVASLIQMNGVDTISLALGDDESCHAGQEERKGESSGETHFDGDEVLEEGIDSLEKLTLKLMRDWERLPISPFPRRMPHIYIKSLLSLWISGVRLLTSWLEYGVRGPLDWPS